MIWSDSGMGGVSGEGRGMSNDESPSGTHGVGWRVGNGRKLRSALGGVVLGTVIAAMGVFFVYALLEGVRRAKETRAWAETACVITKSEVVAGRPTPSSPMAFTAVVEYSYGFGGEDYVGSKVKRVDGSTSHPERAQSVVDAFPLGAETVCWVAPGEPSRAVLRHGTMAPLYSLWFPALFVVAGVGIAVTSVRRAICG